MSVLEYSEEFVKYVKTSPRNVHRCSICDYFTSSVFHMVNHVKKHSILEQRFNCEYANIETYSCKDCNFQTELTFLFKQHMQEQHYIKKERNDGVENKKYSPILYICKTCPFETHFALKWLQHTNSCLEMDRDCLLLRHYVSEQIDDTGIKWYQCTECQHEYKVQHDLNEENAKRCKQSQRRCKQIPKSQIKRKQLTRKYEYKNPYTARLEENLKNQINTLNLDEKAIKLYECEKCSYKAVLKEYLKKHISRRHLDEKDIKWYECDKCPYRAKLKGNLKNHINVRHLDEKDIKWYECEKCPYRAKTKGTLKSHMNAHHLNKNEIKWYECEECPFRTKRERGLKSHINLRHLDAEDIK